MHRAAPILLAAAIAAGCATTTAPAPTPTPTPSASSEAPTDPSKGLRLLPVEYCLGGIPVNASAANDEPVGTSIEMADGVLRVCLVSVVRTKAPTEAGADAGKDAYRFKITIEHRWRTGKPGYIPSHEVQVTTKGAVKVDTTSLAAANSRFPDSLNPGQAVTGQFWVLADQPLDTWTARFGEAKWVQK